MGGPKRRSDVWAHFKNINEKLCQCLLCNKVVKFYGGTTNLRVHLQRLHGDKTINNDDDKSRDDPEIQTDNGEGELIDVVYQDSSKRRSQVWFHFTRLNSQIARCKLCMKKLSYKGGSTCNLLRHMKNRHETPELSDNSEGIITYVMESEKESESEFSLHCHTCSQNVTIENWNEHQELCRNNPLNDQLVEIFIEAVRPRPPLWDDTLPPKMRTDIIRKKLWYEVFDELDGVIPYRELESKWTFLKDMFFMSKKNGTKLNHTRWKYFEMLKFLDEIDDDNESPPQSAPASPVRVLNEPNAKRIEGDIADENDSVVKASSTVTMYPMSPAMLTVSSILEKLPVRVRMKAEIDILNLVYKLYDEQGGQ